MSTPGSMIDQQLADIEARISKLENAREPTPHPPPAPEETQWVRMYDSLALENDLRQYRSKYTSRTPALEVPIESRHAEDWRLEIVPIGRAAHSHRLEQSLKYRWRSRIVGSVVAWAPDEHRTIIVQMHQAPRFGSWGTPPLTLGLQGGTDKRRLTVYRFNTEVAEVTHLEALDPFDFEIEANWLRPGRVQVRNHGHILWEADTPAGVNPDVYYPPFLKAGIYRPSYKYEVPTLAVPKQSVVLEHIVVERTSL